MNGNLLEIFTSYQGEGLWVGMRQIFVRLAGCHLRCLYCDTPESWERAASYRVETEPLSRRFETRPNPVPVAAVLEAVRGDGHSVSITGGEPLLQVGFLRALLPKIPRDVYLETSGTMADRLEEIAEWVRYFSLDFKPPSTEGVKMDWKDFEACVAIAARAEAQVKVVAMAESPTPEEIGRAADILRPHGVPLVITPATEVNEKTRAPDGDRLRELLARARGVRTHVIPQLHPIAGWL